ncbi:MAG: Tn7 transposase TnsA N-terminal domain-containing protein [Limnobacter sp.]|uniref:Tn7 transposase TnsA N-terminal domain-containing protein n=1 Tax=Limnobacter sp. TaxID=2003368 RepID=UPI0039190889
MKERSLEVWGEFKLPEPVRALKRTRLGMQRSSFPSAKCKRVWNLESSIELDYAHFLEWSSDVLQYVPQPMVVDILQAGRRRTYVPDFLHLAKDQRRVVTEIKPSGWDESPQLLDKYRVCHSELQRLGYDFQVVTDTDIRGDELHRNLRHLYPCFKGITGGEILSVITGLSMLNYGRGSVRQLMGLAEAPSYKACAAYAYQNWSDIFSTPFTTNSVLELEG